MEINLPLYSLPASLLSRLRIWWNWQTRYFEVVVPQGVQVQVLLSAPINPRKMSGALDRAKYALFEANESLHFLRDQLEDLPLAPLQQVAEAAQAQPIKEGRERREQQREKNIDHRAGQPSQVPREQPQRGRNENGNHRDGEQQVGEKNQDGRFPGGLRRFQRSHADAVRRHDGNKISHDAEEEICRNELEGGRQKHQQRQ